MKKKLPYGFAACLIIANYVIGTNVFAADVGTWSGQKPGINSQEFQRANGAEFYDESCSTSSSGPTETSQTSDSSNSSSSTTNQGASSTDSEQTPTQTGNGAPTKKDKIAKLLIPLIPASISTDDALKKITKFKFGGSGLVDATGDAAKKFNKEFYDKARSAAGGTFIPMIDEEGGDVSRYGITKPKTAKELGGMEVDAVKAWGQETGQKMKDLGISVDWAPVVDLSYGKGNNDPAAGNHLLNGDWRSFGNNKEVVIAKAGAFSEGLSLAGIKPTYKHFPGLGAADKNTDYHPSSKIDVTENDLAPFKALSSKYSGLVMMSNAYINNLGPADTPASANPALIQKLRGEVGFKGTIITDDLTGPVERWNKGLNLPQLITDSLKAGSDLVLISYNTPDNVIEEIINKASTDVDDARINEAYSNYTATAKDTPQTQTEQSPSNDQCCASSGGSSIKLVSSTGGGGGCGEKGLNSKVNMDQVWGFFLNKFQGEGQYSKDEAEKATAGIMGNWERESSFSPDRHNQPNPGQGCSGAEGPISGNVGMGIAQWCGDRQAELQNFAKEKGTDASCLGTQLEFTWKEMQPRNLVKGMKGASPSEAAAIFNTGGNGAQGFEIGAHTEIRQQFAEKQYKAYTGKEAGNLGTPTSSGGAGCNDSADTSVPPAECGAVVEEARKLVSEGKLKSINGPQNFEDDLKACGKVVTSGACVGVIPEIVRAVVGLTKYIDSVGAGPVTFANFNKGHDCDGGKHTQGRAIDLWYGACNGAAVFSHKGCSETIKWVQQNHAQYDIGAALHNPCPVQGLPNNQGGCNQDGVQYYLDIESEMIHMSIGKDGRW